MPKLSVVAPAARTPLARLVDDYLAAARAAGASPKTIRFSYGFPLKEVFLPWAEEQAITGPAQLDNRVLDRFAVHLRDHGGKRGPLSEHSIWTYVKAVNRFVRWLKEEGEGVAAERDKLIVRVLADTGIRVGELVKLTTSAFEERSGSYFLKVSGKGARERL